MSIIDIVCPKCGDDRLRCHLVKVEDHVAYRDEDGQFASDHDGESSDDWEQDTEGLIRVWCGKCGHSWGEARRAEPKATAALVGIDLDACHEALGAGIPLTVAAQKMLLALAMAHRE